VCFERSVRSDVPDILFYLAESGQPIHQVGFEAGALAQPVTSSFEERHLAVNLEFRLSKEAVMCHLAGRPSLELR